MTHKEKFLKHLKSSLTERVVDILFCLRTKNIIYKLNEIGIISPLDIYTWRDIVMPIEVENRPNVFYTTKEAADKLETTKFSVIRWIADGKLKASKVGKSYRIPEQEIYKLLIGKN